MNKIYIGKQENERIYLTKHKWDCGWYWGFGYVGNKDCHFHMNSIISDFCKKDYKIENILEDSPFNQSEWWIILDLFKQAYAIKEASQVYRIGGHFSSKQGTTDIIKNKDLEDILNNDLEKILNKIWEIMGGK
jgi:hypothetical protein